tara:strand:+ start:299 stop:1162 length:864 start_codon:yes stop_codon:yes gene_type:complete
MKILKYLFSFLIIFFTLKIILKLSKNLEINFYDFIASHYLLICTTIFLQVIGVFLSTHRWRESIKYFSNNPKLKYKFSEFLHLTSRANIINNFLPSILFGDLSKLISPNKKHKKKEMKFIIFDRLIGFFTLGNLGLFSMVYINLLNLYIFFGLLFLEFLSILFFYKIQFKFTDELRKNIFTLNFFKILVLSLSSQLFFSLSLFVLLINVKINSVLLYNFFISIFLNFVGMVPFSINGWGVREWSADKVSLNQLDSNNLIIASIIFGICISISNLLIYLIIQARKFKN